MTEMRKETDSLGVVEVPAANDIRLMSCSRALGLPNWRSLRTSRALRSCQGQPRLSAKHSPWSQCR